jgi:hypothetical protein
VAAPDDVMTPYSTVKPLISDNDLAYWAPDLDRDRIASYQKYEEIYWNVRTAFRLMERGLDDNPIYVPNPRTIVDTTAHFWAKGLKFDAKEGSDLQVAMDAFIKRETLMSKFHTAKHSGVVRGDFVLHLTADPTKPDGLRLSLNSVDPASYFPECDDDDLDRVIAVNLVEQVLDWEDPNKKPVMRCLRYDYVMVDGRRRVQSQETIYEVREWWKQGSRVKIDQVMEPKLLPERITAIPVYHFQNISWQGQPFGSSELRGFERIQAAVNQGVSDEEMALALEGLGVYATDAGRPVNDSGNEVDWEVSPGRVMEIAQGSTFKRVEGVNSVKPFQDHLEFLVQSMYESAGTFRGGTIEASVAESGIALAIRFLPTAAKLEERDQGVVDKFQQFWFDWQQWHFAYENAVLSGEVLVALGDKLPTNKTDVLNMLNNMLDRSTISRQFYREQVSELYGIVIPDDIEAEILAEKAVFSSLIEQPNPDSEGVQPSQQDGGAQPGTKPPAPNASNNKNAPNESKGTEAK